MAETGEVVFGATTIAYSVIRSRRRKKTVEITLDPANGIVVSAPKRLPASDVRRVVDRRARWIIRRSTERMFRPAAKQFVSGESLPYLGRQVRMFVVPAAAKTASVRFDHWSFHVSAPERMDGSERRDAILRAFTAWYRQRALERLTARVRHWSDRTGGKPPRILTRDQRHRWGSCAPDGTLRFNWRIVMAPPSLMDYVVVHELLHLRVRNHGSEFWSEVERALPDFKRRRADLREFGKHLPL